MERSEAGIGFLPKCSLPWGAAVLGFVQEQIGMQTPRDLCANPSKGVYSVRHQILRG